MDIQLEKNSSTEALIKVNLKESDYQSKFKEKLKTYSKQAQIKGFRPGKVPPTLIEKMYGKSIKVEEINNILVETVKDYIKANDIKIIGDPLPNNEKAKEIDWDNQTEFDFEYSIGIIDNFEYKADFKIDKYEILVEDKVIDEAIADLQERYGKMTNPEESAEGDSVFGTLAQISTEFEKGGLIEIPKVSKNLNKQFIGLKKDDIVTFDIQKLFEDDNELEVLTDLKSEEVKALTGVFTFTVKNVNRVMPAEINQEFFDKIFGEGKVSNAEEFRREYVKIFEENYGKESEYLLAHHIQKLLLEETSMGIPEEFYKKWILATNESITNEDLEKDFEHYVRDLKWTLIKNRIAEDNDIKVEHSDMIEYTKNMFKAQFGAMTISEEMENNLEIMANNYLQQNKGEQYMNIYTQLRNEKIMDLIKQKAEIIVNKVSRDEFNKKAEQE